MIVQPWGCSTATHGEVFRRTSLWFSVFALSTRVKHQRRELTILTLNRSLCLFWPLGSHCNLLYRSLFLFLSLCLCLSLHLSQGLWMRRGRWWGQSESSLRWRWLCLNLPLFKGAGPVAMSWPASHVSAMRGNTSAPSQRGRERERSCAIKWTPRVKCTMPCYGFHVTHHP